MEKQRLQKVLANLGHGSRRGLERQIEQGEVRINGKTAVLGDRVAPGDRVVLNDQTITIPDQGPKRRVLIYHKPEGEITAQSDPEGRRTVFESLPRINHGRWINVGRLDFNTSGLLLITNDGELANRLMHPSYGVERSYAVRVLGGLDDTQIEALRTGVMLDDGEAKFTQIKDAGGQGANHWYHVTLHEGRNREVRRMIEAVGGTVSRLIRISYAGISLPPRLRPGKIQELEPEIENALAKLVGLKPTASEERTSSPAQRRQFKPFKAGKKSPQRTKHATAQRHYDKLDSRVTRNQKPKRAKR